MAKNLAIGSHLKLTFNKLRAVRVLIEANVETEATLALFYAAEFLVLATLESEDVPARAWRSASGNHQLSRMIDHLPDSCAIKNDLQELAFLTAYATTHRYPHASGRMPQYPSTDNMKLWNEKIVTLFDRYVKHFQVKVREPNPVAGSVAPFRERKEHDSFSP